MPKVLLIGATGYIGSRLANLLVQSGQHTVYGIARNEAKAKTLAVNEIIPIVCSDPINSPSPYTEAIQKYNVDIVVDVAGANHDSAKFLSEVKRLGQERLNSHKTAGIQGGPKLGFVYCSGTWVHGSSNTAVTDLDVVGAAHSTKPPSLVAWRVGLEKEVLASADVLEVAVVRPALIYGRECSIWTTFLLPLLQAAQSGSTDTVRILLERDSRPGLIHVDDVASGFKAVIEKLTLINSGSTYPVFDLVTSQESMEAVFEAAAAAWGFKGECELVGAGDNAFAEAMSTSFNGSSARARQLLGWEPSRLRGFVPDMDLYAAAFASQH